LQTPNDVRSDGSVFRERTPRDGAIKRINPEKETLGQIDLSQSTALLIVLSCLCLVEGPSGRLRPNDRLVATISAAHFVVISLFASEKAKRNLGTVPSGRFSHEAAGSSCFSRSSQNLP
jgi:hypothetical protein